MNPPEIPARHQQAGAGSRAAGAAEFVILGSGVGFPTPERFSTSIALLAGDRVYIFDCGEPCAALLIRNGIDPVAVRAIFISHMHADHAGGLAGLLFAMYLGGRTDARRFRPWSVSRDQPWYRQAIRSPRDPQGSGMTPDGISSVSLVVPSEAIDSVRAYLPAVYLAPSILPFDLRLQPIGEGLTFDDGVVSVEARANAHLSADFAYAPLPVEYPHITLQSYSMAIGVAGHRVVYAGGINALDDLDRLVGDADTLLLEVAHVDPADIGPYVRDLPAKRIVLTHIHPGLEDRLPSLVQAWQDPRIEVAVDGLRIRLA